VIQKTSANRSYNCRLRLQDVICVHRLGSAICVSYLHCQKRSLASRHPTLDWLGSHCLPKASYASRYRHQCLIDVLSPTLSDGPRSTNNNLEYWISQSRFWLVTSFSLALSCTSKIILVMSYLYISPQNVADISSDLIHRSCSWYNLRSFLRSYKPILNPCCCLIHSISITYRPGSHYLF